MEVPPDPGIQVIPEFADRMARSWLALQAVVEEVAKVPCMFFPGIPAECAYLVQGPACITCRARAILQAKGEGEK